MAAWSRQEGTGGGFFWISSLKQVERWAGAGSEAWPFFLDVRLSFSAALRGRREVTCHTAETYGVTRYRRRRRYIFTHSNFCFTLDYIYLAKRDIAAVLAMVTTLDMWGIFELVCTIPASPQPSAASSAACSQRKLIIKIQIYNCTPAPTPKGAIISGITLGTGAGCVWLSRTCRLTAQWVKHTPYSRLQLWLAVCGVWGIVCDCCLSLKHDSWSLPLTHTLSNFM